MEMIIDIAFLVGRILFGGYFLMNGLNHLTKHSMITAYAASKGVPAPGLAVAGSGLLILLGGLGALLGVMTYSLILILIFLIPVTLIMHRFWIIEDPTARMGEMINFTKNVALIGACLIMLGLQYALDRIVIRAL